MVHELTPRLLDAISGTGEMLCAPLLAAAIVAKGRRSRAGGRHRADRHDRSVRRRRAADGGDPRQGRGRGCGRLPTRGDPGRDRLHRVDRRRRADDARPRRVGLLGVDHRRGARRRRSVDLDRRRRRDDRQSRPRSRRADAGEISYSEASELAYYGAKVLHYKTILPAFRQRHPGAHPQQLQPVASGHARQRVEGDPSAPGVKAVTSIRNVALIAISGTGMQGIPGIVAKTFDVVAAQQANMLMISQASSENNICFVISAAEAPARRAGRCARRSRSSWCAGTSRRSPRETGGDRRGGRRPHARHAGHRRDRVRRAGRPRASTSSPSRRGRRSGTSRWSWPSPTRTPSVRAIHRAFLLETPT